MPHPPWAPIGLPVMRDEFAEFVAIIAKYAAEQVRRPDGFEVYITQHPAHQQAWAASLRAATLWWVTPEMTALAFSVAADLPEWTPVAAMPSEVGMLVWDGDLPPVPWEYTPKQLARERFFGKRTIPSVPMHGVAWAPSSKRLHLTLLGRPENLPSGPHGRPPEEPRLMPVADIDTPWDRPEPWGDDEWKTEVLQVIGATWLLMQQPTVARSIPTLRSPQHGGHSPRGRPPADVSVIELRRLLHPPHERDPDAEPTRVYRHRWVVRGHWRQQACGPGWSQRKPVYVPWHLKGPDGAPLLAVEHVNMWRR